MCKANDMTDMKFSLQIKDLDENIFVSICDSNSAIRLAHSGIREIIL